MRKSKLVVLFTALSITACITCLNGCGKQGVEPVMAATLEEVAPTSEVTTEEESVVATEEETESIQDSENDETETESVTVQDYTITEMNKEMEVIQDATTFATPSADTAVGGVKQDEIVKVTGIVDGSDWYQIDQEGTTSFIESIYLKELETQQPQDQNNNNGNENSNQDQNKQQPKAETPSKTDPQPPVDPPVVDPAPQPQVDPPSEGVTILPDGSVMTSDGTVVKPGDPVGGGMIWGGTSAAWGMSDYY